MQWASSFGSEARLFTEFQDNWDLRKGHCQQFGVDFEIPNFITSHTRLITIKKLLVTWDLHQNGIANVNAKFFTLSEKQTDWSKVIDMLNSLEGLVPNKPELFYRNTPRLRRVWFTKMLIKTLMPFQWRFYVMLCPYLGTFQSKEQKWTSTFNENAKIQISFVCSQYVLLCSFPVINQYVQWTGRAAVS